MLVALRNYLKELFGVETILAPITNVSALPVMYPALFQLYQGAIEQLPCAFAVDRQTMHLTPGQIKKHILFLSEKFQIPFVYVGPLTDAHATERMIAARTPFIAPGKSLYLPFAGIALSRNNKTPVIQKDHLGYCAQLILLGVLLKKIPQPSGIADILRVVPFGPSSIHTAFHELEHFKLGNESTLPGSRAKIFRFDLTGEELWNKAQDVLFNPCKRTVGLVAPPPENSATIAGADALAQISMLNEQSPTVLAMELAEFRKHPVEIVPLESAEIKLQLWLYNPCIFGKDRIDLLSLALSLKNDPDERVQIALESAMKEFSW